MAYYYSANRNVQLLVALLKAHGIRKVIASPGTTNMELVGSLQHDGSFEMYSCVDERSAAYMACGLCAETGEPVVITCTEATASRNYYPGLTEAYHRKLPILAVTGLHGYGEAGQLTPQAIDRDASPSDTVRLKVHLFPVRTPQDEWDSTLNITRAILELTRHGGGPVHLDLPCRSAAGTHVSYFSIFSVFIDTDIVKFITDIADNSKKFADLFRSEPDSESVIYRIGNQLDSPVRINIPANLFQKLCQTVDRAGRSGDDGEQLIKRERMAHRAEDAQVNFQRVLKIQHALRDLNPLDGTFHSEFIQDIFDL